MYKIQILLMHTRNKFRSSWRKGGLWMCTIVMRCWEIHQWWTWFLVENVYIKLHFLIIIINTPVSMNLRWLAGSTNDIVVSILKSCECIQLSFRPSVAIRRFVSDIYWTSVQSHTAGGRSALDVLNHNGFELYMTTARWVRAYGFVMSVCCSWCGNNFG